MAGLCHKTQVVINWIYPSSEASRLAHEVARQQDVANISPHKTVNTH